MARVGGRLSAEQKRELWARFKRGETTVEIGRALGRSTGNIYSFVQSHGGFAPRERKRRATHLRLDEREEISRGIVAGLSLTAIADRIGRPLSTISREVARNGGRDAYRAILADARAGRAALRPKPCLLARNPVLRDRVASMLAAYWSPEQIAASLKAEAIGEGMRVSHETIYRSLFIQARGVLRKELTGALRSRKPMRRGHGVQSAGMKRSLIPDAVSIRERPAEAEDRAVPGHWEGDLLTGKIDTRIVTLVERRSRFVMLAKLGSKQADDVVEVLARRVKALPVAMMKTLTWDRGSEMTGHAKFTLATDVKVYFCDPHSPWQRGSNENTNGLLRQYLPKGTDLSRVSQAELDAIADSLNTRPRQTLGWKTPAQVLNEHLALTG